MINNNSKNEAELGDAISNRLKDYYQSVEEEPIPEHFLGLLEKLDEAEEKANKDGGNK